MTALLLIVGLVPVTMAAETTETPNESITLSPANQLLELDPGEVKRGELTILNDGEVDYDFIVYSRPYSVSDYSYDKNFEDEVPNSDLYKWVQFDETSKSLPAGETIKIGYTLRVPDNAPPGGHYGVLFAEVQPGSQPDATSIARKKRVGSLVHAEVSGDIRRAGDVEMTDIKFWQRQAPLEAVVRINNTGNSHFLAKHRFTVRDVFGNVKYDENREQIILPGTVRDVALQWSDAPYFGLFKVDVTTEFLGGVKDAKSGYVLMAPMWLLIVAGLAIITGAVYAVLQRRRR